MRRPVGSSLIVAGLIALALLALGEAAPAAFPVHLSLQARSSTGEVQVDVDGQTHSVPSSLAGDWRRVVLEQPGPVDREYQIDGSDATSTDDRNAMYIAGLLKTPLYELDAFLRDESSYSRFEHLSIADLATGQPVSADGPLPPDFRLEVDLRRPEAAARVWLVNAAGDQREGLELDRDKRNARWVIDRGRGIEPLPRWFFPEQPAPFAAELLQLLGRSVVAGYAIVVVAFGLATGLRAIAGAPPVSNFRGGSPTRGGSTLVVGAARAGALGEGALREGPLGEGPLGGLAREGGLGQGPVGEGPVGEAPLGEESVRGPAREKPLGEEPLDERPVGEGPLGGLAREGALGEGPLGGLAREGALGEGLLGGGSVGGPAREGAPGEGLLGEGPLGGPAREGALGEGLLGGGSIGGPAREGALRKGPVGEAPLGAEPLGEGQPCEDRGVGGHPEAGHRVRIPRLTGDLVMDITLALWLVAAALVATLQYHQLPHILDAVSYTFQAGLFATGQVSLPAPPLTEAFKGPFEVVWQGRIFSQYPPGAAAFYALGRLVSLEWLVGPLACVVLIGASAWTARSLYGPACGLAALGLGVISPFILFQAGSYLSHPIAGGLVAGAIAAFVAGERYRSDRWYAVCGALLGAAFLVREVASVLVAIPLAVRLVACRRWSAMLTIVAFGVPFVVAYLVYNLRQTGSPLLLPRQLFDPSDHFGFGDGVGFHTRQTLAAGLANTDELLTLLQFDLFGWPPLFALGLMSVPFLFGRARAWDYMALGGFGAFVVAYVGYFYHGIALGPRYYFEAMPWLLLLGARGVQVLAQVASSRVIAGALVGALTLNTLLFYTPAELDRRTDLSGMAGGLPLSLGFVRSSLFGPQLVGVPSNALVVTDDWWVYNAALSALNCPRLPNCDVLFALATNTANVDQLRTQFPGRTLMRATYTGGLVTVTPY